MRRQRLGSSRPSRWAQPWPKRVRNSVRPRGFGFVTAWTGAAGKILFDVRLRTDGTTVVRYRGKRKKAGKLVDFTGTFRGKLTPKRRAIEQCLRLHFFSKGRSDCRALFHSVAWGEPKGSFGAGG